MSAVLGQPGRGPWSPGGCCVPWLGIPLKSLDPLTPGTVTLLCPVPHSLALLASLGSATCGIPSVPGCATIRPHCWDGDRASCCVLWGSSHQLRAPQPQAMSVCLVSLGSCPGDGGTFPTVLSLLAVVPCPGQLLRRVPARQGIYRTNHTKSFLLQSFSI